MSIKMEVDESRAVERKIEFKIIGEIRIDTIPDPKLSKDLQVFRGGLINSIKNVVVRRVEIKEYEEFLKRIDREFKAAKESETIRNVLNIEKIEKDSDGKFCYIAYENFDYILLNLHELNMDFEIKQILWTATEGLMYFHEKGYVHRNIQPENVVILEENNQFISKISDLSMSKFLSDGKNATISRDFSENSCSAPELINYYKQDKGNQKKSRGEIQKKKVKKEVDVFSMGIVYFYALTKNHLFDTDGQSWQQNICNKSFKPNFSTLNSSRYLKPWEVQLATQLIKSMVQYEPNRRPTVKLILNHPLFWTIERKREFLFVTSQYIHGSDIEKDILNIQYGPNYNNWAHESKDVLKQIKEKRHRNYGTNITELLRLLRNLPAHVKEKKNEDLRNFFKDCPGGVTEHFSEKFPNYFYDLYNFFNEHSSYDTLREFYCDCYLSGRFDIHKCGSVKKFCSYNWENNEFS